MKTLNLTYMECMRLWLMCSSQTGTRKDSRTRTILGLCDRLKILPEKAAQYVKPLDGDRVILDVAGMSQEPVRKIQVTAEEARIALEMVDALPLRVDELRGWADELAKKLEAACA